MVTQDKLHVPEASLRATVTAIFEKLGETPEDAALGADTLLDADLRGIEMQGVTLLLPIQVQRYRDGWIKPRAEWKIIRETPGTVTIDSDHGLVWILGTKYMQLAVEKARNVGVGSRHRLRRQGLRAHRKLCPQGDQARQGSLRRDGQRATRHRAPKVRVLRHIRGNPHERFHAVRPPQRKQFPRLPPTVATAGLCRIMRRALWRT